MTCAKMFFLLTSILRIYPPIEDFDWQVLTDLFSKTISMMKTLGNAIKKYWFSRFLRTILAVLMLLGFSAVIAEGTTLLPLETFDGTFPPTGWSVTNDNGGPVVWHRSDQYPNFGAAQPLPISGLHAHAESYPAYCGYSYDTSLITPPFSTIGVRNIELRFDYQFWVYNSEVLALDYRIGAGP
jgi:hypothetical protein